MPDHRDKPASALARGPVKTSDIERARRDARDADARAVRRAMASRDQAVAAARRAARSAGAFA